MTDNVDADATRDTRATILRAVNSARRPANESDRDAARRIHHDAYRAVVERQFGPWDEVTQDQFFADDWKGAAFDVLLIDGVPVGYLSVEHRAVDVHVREIVLTPAVQGRGIGTEILREIIEQAEGRDVPVRLATFHQNRASALFQRLGFQVVGRTNTHVIFERGTDPEPVAPH